MMAPLLKGVELTPGQLAELRAIDALYYTRLASYVGEPTDVAARSPTPSEQSSVLSSLVLARVRDMLHDEQRVIFDRNREARQSEQARDSDHTERYR